MARLITRLRGRRVLVQLVPTGVGTLAYAGEYRDERGRPVATYDGSRRICRVVIGRPTAAGLCSVLSRLRGTAYAVPLYDLDVPA